MAPPLSRQVGRSHQVTPESPTGRCCRSPEAQASDTNRGSHTQKHGSNPCRGTPLHSESSSLPWLTPHCAVPPENSAGAAGATGRVWGGYGKNFPILREELSPKKNSQHLRSRALGILSRGAGSKANRQTNRDRVRKSWGVCSSGTRDLWLIRNKLPRRQGGKEAFSGHVSSPFPALWELN